MGDWVSVTSKRRLPMTRVAAASVVNLTATAWTADEVIILRPAKAVMRWGRNKRCHDDRGLATRLSNQRERPLGGLMHVPPLFEMRNSFGGNRAYLTPSHACDEASKDASIPETLVRLHVPESQTKVHVPTASLGLRSTTRSRRRPATNICLVEHLLSCRRASNGQ